MSNHRLTILGERHKSQARCSCGKRSPIGDRGDVDEWWFKHNQEIERIRAYLGTRNPTLKSQHAWFVHQAENPDNEFDDRQLWRQLADEIERHLKSKEPMEQDSLFD